MSQKTHNKGLTPPPQDHEIELTPETVQELRAAVEKAAESVIDAFQDLPDAIRDSQRRQREIRESIKRGVRPIGPGGRVPSGRIV